MFAWAGNANHPGGSIASGQPEKTAVLPIQLQCSQSQLRITFPEALDPNQTRCKKCINQNVVLLSEPPTMVPSISNERSLEESSLSLSDDSQTLILHVPKLSPTWGMEIKYVLRTKSGMTVRGTVITRFMNSPSKRRRSRQVTST